jgi:hypothetical protein
MHFLGRAYCLRLINTTHTHWDLAILFQLVSVWNIIWAARHAYAAPLFTVGPDLSHDWPGDFECANIYVNIGLPKLLHLHALHPAGEHCLVVHHRFTVCPRSFYLSHMISCNRPSMMAQGRLGTRLIGLIDSMSKSKALFALPKATGDFVQTSM